jgi:hypothetical protein
VCAITFNQHFKNVFQAIIRKSLKMKFLQKLFSIVNGNGNGSGNTPNGKETDNLNLLQHLSGHKTSLLKSENDLEKKIAKVC